MELDPGPMLAPIRLSNLLVQARIRWVNWESADLAPYDVGGYSVIYQLVPGLVMKAGLIEPEEVAIQQQLAQRGLALPVLDYDEQVVASERVRRAVCSEHGIRPVVANRCTCHETVGVLMMPQASPLPERMSAVASQEIDRFMERVSEICVTELGVAWDAVRKNVARFGSRLVALDFGDPDREDW